METIHWSLHGWGPGTAAPLWPRLSGSGTRAGIGTLVRLLFAEPSPAPVRHWLWRTGLIDSPEARLPMTGVTEAPGARLDREIGRSGDRADRDGLRRHRRGSPRETLWHPAGRSRVM